MVYHDLATAAWYLIGKNVLKQKSHSELTIVAGS